MRYPVTLLRACRLDFRSLSQGALLLCLPGLLLLAGCGAGTSPNDNTQGAPTVVVSVSPTSVTSGGLSAASSAVLTITATNATQVTVTGTDGSSYTLAAAGGTKTVTPAVTTTYTVTALGAGGVTVSASATVTLIAKTVASISVTPLNTSIFAGATEQLTATATYSDGTTANVTTSASWTSLNAAVATVNSAGLATGVGAGSTSVTTSLGGVSGTEVLTVAAAPAPPKTVMSIAVTSSSASLAIGATQQLTATATYSDQTTANVTTAASWTSLNPAVATVNSAGLATGVGAGSTSVTASLGGLSGTEALTVAAAPKTVTSIAIASLIASVAIGATQQLTATATYSDGNTANVTALASWTSLNAAVATVNSAGLATGVAAGSTSVTASLGGVSGTEVLTVAAAPKTVTAIAVSSSVASVAIGATQQLTATATYSDQTTANVTTSASWTSLNAAIATVNSAGLATGVAAGSTNVTASWSGVSGTEALAVTAGNAVLMHHNDLPGDGANLNEVTLTPANVNATNFGRKYALPVDGQIYTQPLYVPGLMINGAAHNTVFAATQNDSVYAFDSDSGSQLWKVSLGTPVPNNDPEGVQPTLGILSTPVIDASSNTIYVTAVTTGHVLKLHALDITTGAEKLGGPVTVTASVPGTGAGSANGMVPLSGGCYQRTALVLANGSIYMGFGHCDHGWMLAYSASTLAQTQAWNTSPNGVGGDIWMGGAGPVVDSNGNLYLESADDIGSSAPSATDYPDAFLKMSPDLQVLDFFIPSDERYLESNDADLGSGAPILMPNNGSPYPNELIGGGKDGRVFVVNRNGMGGYHADPNGQNDNLQTIQTGTQQFDNIWGQPAFWNGSLYFHTEGDVLRSYAWNPGNSGLLSGSSTTSGNSVYLNHGASPSISANGTSAGIVWDIDDSGYPQNGGSGGTPAVLHAYDATDVRTELYNSKQAANGRDTAGHACKFSVPTVTDGKVFVPTCTELDIYGLLP